MYKYITHLHTGNITLKCLLEFNILYLMFCIIIQESGSPNTSLTATKKDKFTEETTPSQPSTVDVSSQPPTVDVSSQPPTEDVSSQSSTGVSTQLHTVGVSLQSSTNRVVSLQLATGVFLQPSTGGVSSQPSTAGVAILDNHSEHSANTTAGSEEALLMV